MNSAFDASPPLSLSLSIKSVIFKLIFLPPLKSLHLKITSEKKKRTIATKRRDFKFSRDLIKRKFVKDRTNKPLWSHTLIRPLIIIGGLSDTDGEFEEGEAR